MSNILRHLARNRAKTNMKKIGMRRVCKGDYFCKHWRRFNASWGKKPKKIEEEK